VLDAGNDAAALALVETRERDRERPVDVVVTEVTSPARTAWTLVDKLRVTNPHLPAVIVSRGRDSAPAGDHPPPNAAILYKPLAPRVLARQVRELLDEARR
jgi:DNA-binding NtrC family response regulator